MTYITFLMTRGEDYLLLGWHLCLVYDLGWNLGYESESPQLLAQEYFLRHEITTPQSTHCESLSPFT